MEIPKIEISAEKIVDKVLDEIEFKGTSIREWAEYLIRNADDLISRQAAIYNLANIAKNCAKSDKQKALTGRCIYMIENMPSVQPKQKTGRWIDMDDHVMCICCGATHYGADKNYCPNCGAKMESDKNDN